MQCFSCGKETSNIDKICDACKSVQAKPFEPAKEVATTAPRFDYKSHTLLRTVVILISAFIGWRWAGGLWQKIDIAVAENTIGISSSESTFVNYRMTKATRISGRAIDIDLPSLSVRKGGVGAFVFYLTEAEYQELERDYTKTGKCPAGYLNAHSKALALVPGSEVNVEQLKSLSLNKGDKIFFEGESLEYNGGKLGGLDFDFNAGKASFMHVSHARVNEAVAF